MFEALHDTDPAERFVHLGIRADMPAEPTLRRVMDRLDALEANRRLAGYEVTTWPARVRFDIEPTDDSVLDRFHRFWAWADRRGVAVSPAFEIRQGTTMLGEHEQILDTPVLFAWVTVDGAIQALAPVSDGSVTYRVQELLDALESAPLDPAGRAISA